MAGSGRGGGGDSRAGHGLVSALPARGSFPRAPPQRPAANGPLGRREGRGGRHLGAGSASPSPNNPTSSLVQVKKLRHSLSQVRPAPREAA